MACGIAPEFIAILSVTAGITLPLVGSVVYMQVKLNECIGKNACCEGFLRIICCEQRDIAVVSDVVTVPIDNTIASQPPPYILNEKCDNMCESTY